MNVQDSAPGAVGDTAANANAMTASHSVSGCGSNFDVTTNTDTTCELSGPLYEADEELKRIANAGISEAKKMAARRADALFDLELQQQYAADYRLYELAVQGGFTEAHTASGINNLDQVDALSDSSPLKTKNLQLTISNIKTVGLASSSVKDVVCEQHDMSEADSKATYLFKAAAATWLMAVVNDTDYYSAESNCRVQEEITEDRSNMQVESIERAANVHDQMLENLCMRVTPPAAPAPGYDWRDYGNTEEQAAMYVKVLTGYTTAEGTEYPPLKQRCEEYLVKLRGEEFRDKPRTREAALEMMVEAEALALEELLAKNEKIMIAKANVDKGEKWVAQTLQRLAIMAALLAVVSAAQANAQGTCAGCGPFCGFCCSMCPVAAKLAMQAAWIAGTVIAVWLMSELMRAKAFLAKWKKKLEHAKYFTHLACNFETAQAEEDTMAELGDAAKTRRKQEVERARRDAIRGFNEQVNELVTQDNPAASTSMLELLMDMVVSPAYAASEVTGKIDGTGAPENALAATRDQKRNVFSNTNALNIAEGTESFRYFLVQRNLQFQNQSNDITNQPKHSRSNPEIANAGSKPKNVKPAIIRSVEELGQFHIDGKPMEAVSDLAPEERTGFPVPETRYITIQNARMIFQENINLLHGGIAEVTYQRDQVVDLLTATRKRLDIDDAGLGDTSLIPNAAPKPVCVVGELESLNFDPSCGCQKEESCASFEYPKFTVTTPGALKNQGILTTDTANNLLSGNLSGAAVNGGRLTANAAAVRDDLLDLQSKLGQEADRTPSGKRKFGAVSDSAKELSQATEDQATSSLQKLGVNSTDSPLGRIRRQLLNDNESNTASLTATSNSGSDKDKRRNSARAAARRNAKKSKSKKEEVSSETFSLTDGNGNLDLQSLTDEEKRRLGLLGPNEGKEGEEGDQNNGHVRRISEQGKNKSNANSAFSGIHRNRNRNLFQDYF